MSIGTTNELIGALISNLIKRGPSYGEYNSYMTIMVSIENEDEILQKMYRYNDPTTNLNYTFDFIIGNFTDSLVLSTEEDLEFLYSVMNRLHINTYYFEMGSSWFDEESVIIFTGSPLTREEMIVISNVLKFALDITFSKFTKFTIETNGAKISQEEINEIHQVFLDIKTGIPGASDKYYCILKIDEEISKRRSQIEREEAAIYELEEDKKTYLKELSPEERLLYETNDKKE